MRKHRSDTIGKGRGAILAREAIIWEARRTCLTVDDVRAFWKLGFSVEEGPLQRVLDRRPGR